MLADFYTVVAGIGRRNRMTAWRSIKRPENKKWVVERFLGQEGLRGDFKGLRLDFLG